MRPIEGTKGQRLVHHRLFGWGSFCVLQGDEFRWNFFGGPALLLTWIPSVTSLRACCVFAGPAFLLLELG